MKPNLDQGPDYERGFVDGMLYQTQTSVDKAVNAMAQPEQEPVAWEQFYPDIGKPQLGQKPVAIYRAGQAKGEGFHVEFLKEMGDDEVLLYTTPPPCPTCEALARTVMLDQTSHDTKRPWVGLTDEDIAYAYTLEKKFAMQYVDAKLKELNT